MMPSPSNKHLEPNFIKKHRLSSSLPVGHWPADNSPVSLPNASFYDSMDSSPYDLTIPNAPERHSRSSSTDSSQSLRQAAILSSRSHPPRTKTISIVPLSTVLKSRQTRPEPSMMTRSMSVSSSITKSPAAKPTRRSSLIPMLLPDRNSQMLAAAQVEEPPARKRSRTRSEPVVDRSEAYAGYLIDDQHGEQEPPRFNSSSYPKADASSVGKGRQLPADRPAIASKAQPVISKRGADFVLVTPSTASFWEQTPHSGSAMGLRNDELALANFAQDDLDYQEAKLLAPAYKHAPGSRKTLSLRRPRVKVDEALTNAYNSQVSLPRKLKTKRQPSSSPASPSLSCFFSSSGGDANGNSALLPALPVATPAVRHADLSQTQLPPSPIVYVSPTIERDDPYARPFLCGMVRNDSQESSDGMNTGNRTPELFGGSVEPSSVSSHEDPLDYVAFSNLAVTDAHDIRRQKTLSQLMSIDDDYHFLEAFKTWQADGSSQGHDAFSETSSEGTKAAFVARELCSSERSYVNHLSRLLHWLQVSTAENASMLVMVDNNSPAVDASAQTGDVNRPVYQTLLLHHLPTLLVVSNLLLQRWADDASPAAISRTFLLLQPHLEQAFLTWTQILPAVLTSIRNCRSAHINSSRSVPSTPKQSLRRTTRDDVPPSPSRSFKQRKQKTMPAALSAGAFTADSEPEPASPVTSSPTTVRRRSWVSMASPVRRAKSNAGKPRLEARPSSARFLDVSDIVIMPIQRISRYQLFLREMLKAPTIDAGLQTLINEAIHSVQATAAICDAFKDEDDATRL